jgi:hypothetical protein
VKRKMRLAGTQILPLAAVVMVMVAAFAMAAPVAAAPMQTAVAQEATSSNLPKALTIKFWGQAYIAVDDQTIKHYRVNATLTATITSQFWWILNVEDVHGTVAINGVQYTITEGRGISRWIFPVLECSGVDADGNYLDFILRGAAWPIQAD